MNYRYFRSFLPRAELLAVRERMVRLHQARKSTQGRAGFTLGIDDPLFDILSPLVAQAAQWFGGPAVLKPAWSACQWIEPGAGLEFPPHQDIAALKIKSPADRGCVFWIPLDDITPAMPTLAVCNKGVPAMTHVGDARGISVLKKKLIDARWQWEIFTHARIGDVVQMDALTMHRTHVPDPCTEGRLSLDVRAKPL